MSSFMEKLSLAFYPVSAGGGAPFALSNRLYRSARSWIHDNQSSSKAGLLAANRFQLYLHGGQKLWDYAAGNLILREAGGSAVTLDGSPIPGFPHGPPTRTPARLELQRKWPLT